MTVPAIRTARFELVSMSLAFMHRLVERDLAAAERELGATVPADLPDQLEHFLQFRIADLERDPAARPWLGRAIVLTDQDGSRRTIGTIGFHGPPDEDGRVEIGYRVDADFRRQGIATEVVSAMFAWANGRGVHRFRASISPDNAASKAVVARFGFREVGVQIDEFDGEERIFELDVWPPTADGPVP